ncbi:uncharacterized protein RBU33_017736 [Hipposideros larvatus]
MDEWIKRRLYIYTVEYCSAMEGNGFLPSMVSWMDLEGGWSIFTGLISIVCFLFTTLHQLYVAYRSGKVGEALSRGFLLCWVSRDLTNFIGCYLTNQLPIQDTLGIIEMSSFICGYTSCIFCLGARVPQLYRNIKIEISN